MIVLVFLLSFIVIIEYMKLATPIAIKANLIKTKIASMYFVVIPSLRK